MNRVGLKDYLLNHADDNDLLGCAKAWDAANEYGQFDTYSSVEEAAQANGWDAAQALSEARRVDQDADFFRFNGYGHLETKQRIEFDAEQGDDFGEVSKYLGEFFNSGSVNQSEKINDSWGNSILVKGGNGRYDGPRGGITVYENFEDVDLPAAIEENRNVVELVVSVAAAPYMDPDKLSGCEQGLDSLCEEKIDEAQTLRYGMEGVGLPMLDAAEHLANY